MIERLLREHKSPGEPRRAPVVHHSADARRFTKNASLMKQLKLPPHSRLHDGDAVYFR